MLTNTLTHERHLSNFTPIEYNELVTLEEEIQTAVDANNEHEENDLFYALDLTSLYTHIVHK